MGWLQTVDWKEQCPHWIRLLACHCSLPARRRCLCFVGSQGLASRAYLPTGTTFQTVGTDCCWDRVVRWHRSSPQQALPNPSRRSWVWNPEQQECSRPWRLCCRSHCCGWLWFLAKSEGRATKHVAHWNLAWTQGIFRGQTPEPITSQCRALSVVWPSGLRMVRHLRNLTVS